MKLEQHSHNVNWIRRLVDLFFVWLSWVFAYVIRFSTGWFELPKGIETWSRHLLLSVPLVLVYGISFATLGLYSRSLGKRRVINEQMDLMRCHFYSFVVVISLGHFVLDYRYSRLTSLLFFSICIVWLALGRSLIRKMDRVYLKQRSSQLLGVFWGEPEIYQRLLETSDQRRDWNLEIKAKFSNHELEAFTSYISKENPDIVFLSYSGRSGTDLESLLAPLQKTVSDIMVIPDLGKTRFLTSKVGYLDRIPFVSLNSSGIDSTSLALKRVFDFVFALLFIVFFSPVFLVCMFLVKLTSPGPIFYSQERMGMDGKSFRCFKFRGMRVDAEAATGPVWAKKDDPRVTWIGKWLRKSSLDEIPQFYNVLRGEMSVVGPRPERPVFVSSFKEQIPGYMLRHKVKAGITGWAQVCGWRGDTSIDKRIECDLWYIQNWSFWLDIKIIILTPFKGLVHRNAY
jgi:Undecaprenyl-phosphate glucose phosphotransferase